MEVHHHSHTSRKKWTHYFWEFLMLFLAVFCGFLAEYQLEHTIEKQREKQYMQSMIEDLTSDTSLLNDKIKLIDSILLPVFRKPLDLLYAKDFSDKGVKEMYAYVPSSTRFLDINFEDRTISQLKNSGNLRLIRNKEVTDSLASYSKLQNSLSNVLLPGYEKARLVVKDIYYSLFDFSYYAGNVPFFALRNDAPFTLLSHDKAQFIKLANFISNLNSQADLAIRVNLIEAKKKAAKLIGLIKGKYNFE